jgi:hypothetical protein
MHAKHQFEHAIVDQMKLLDDERDKSDDKNPQINKAIASVINK